MFLYDKQLTWEVLERMVCSGEPTHEDGRRTLYATVIGDVEHVVIVYKQRVVLGNHRHPYAELWWMKSGRGEVVLVQPSGTRQHLTLNQGEQLLIDAGVAHAITAHIGAVLVITKPAQAYVAEPYQVT